MELETALAATSWDRVTNRDAEKTYTLMTFPALQALGVGGGRVLGLRLAPSSGRPSPSATTRGPDCEDKYFHQGTAVFKRTKWR